jgi:hypothetical protein
MGRFQIITDTATYTQGEATDAFGSLGYDQAGLEDFKEVGDWIELVYTGGLKISIPESRIQYIAETGV